MNDSKFQVFVSDYTSSVDEWQRALQASESELPELTEEQKEVARRFRVSEKEYARGVLAGRYGNERIRDKGQALGEYAELILRRSRRQLQACGGLLGRLQATLGVENSGARQSCWSAGAVRACR